MTERMTLPVLPLRDFVLFPGVTVERSSRVVDDGVITSAGVASGIDMSFYIVETVFGRAVADETAKYIEYRR